MKLEGEELRAVAERECRRAEGDTWDSLYSGDQEACIQSWIDGYNFRDVEIREMEELGEKRKQTLETTPGQ